MKIETTKKNTAVDLHQTTTLISTGGIESGDIITVDNEKDLTEQNLQKQLQVIRNKRILHLLKEIVAESTTKSTKLPEEIVSEKTTEIQQAYENPTQVVGQKPESALIQQDFISLQTNPEDGNYTETGALDIDNKKVDLVSTSSPPGVQLSTDQLIPGHGNVR